MSRRAQSCLVMSMNNTLENFLLAAVVLLALAYFLTPLGYDLPGIVSARIAGVERELARVEGR